uniref:Protein STB5 n=1 Tax=Talaromyces marneffei PM1 TaxID=1077442 RepID=A0A093UYU4_TALMA
MRGCRLHMFMAAGTRSIGGDSRTTKGSRSVVSRRQIAERDQSTNDGIILSPFVPVNGVIDVSQHTKFSLPAIKNLFPGVDEECLPRIMLPESPSDPSVTVRETTSSTNNQQPVRPALRKVPLEVDLRVFIKGYFDHVHKSSPFLNKIKTMEEVDIVLRQMRNTNGRHVSTKLYMLAAIGGAALKHANKIRTEIAAKLVVPYQSIICECIEMENVCIEEFFVQRRVGLTAEDTELRARLFWSSFELDRVVASSYGLPVAINDANIDLPLPGVTLEEFAASDLRYYRETLQVSRSVVALRDLEGRILQRIHLSNSASDTALSRSDCDIIIKDLRLQIDNWYAQGCLISHSDNDKAPLHNTIPWLNVNYYSSLILLYTPSQFNSKLSRKQLVNLRRTIQQYIRCALVLLEQGHLSFNRVTVGRLLVIAAIMLFCFRRQRGVIPEDDFKTTEEVSMCIRILDAFPSNWIFAQRVAIIFWRLHKISSDREMHHRRSLQGSIQSSTSSSGPDNILSPASTLPSDHQSPTLSPLSTRMRNNPQSVPPGYCIKALTNDVSILISDTFGPSSAFNRIIDQIDDNEPFAEEYRWDSSAHSSLHDPSRGGEQSNLMNFLTSDPSRNPILTKIGNS